MQMHSAPVRHPAPVRTCQAALRKLPAEPGAPPMQMHSAPAPLIFFFAMLWPIHFPKAIFGEAVQLLIKSLCKVIAFGTRNRPGRPISLVAPRPLRKPFVLLLFGHPVRTCQAALRKLPAEPGAPPMQMHSAPAPLIFFFAMLWPIHFPKTILGEAVQLLIKS